MVCTLILNQNLITIIKVRQLLVVRIYTYRPTNTYDNLEIVDCRYSRGGWMAHWIFSEAGKNISLDLVT